MTALATDSGRKTPARLASSAILACQSDERLVKLARAGHERAFDAIVDRYRKPLVRYCARILPDSRCEDAVQQAFINVHAALLASDEEVQLKPWLYAITRNAALNMLRQNGWNYDPIPLDFDGVRRPDQVFEERSHLEQTVAAMNDLPERQRNALVMREFEGRSYDEIALALGANDGAVRQLLNRARGTLRNAVSLLMPPPLVARAVASMPPSDGHGVAEVAGSLGAAGIAKAGATALVAGSLVVGAVNAPLPLGDSHRTTRQKATLVPATARTPSAHDTPVALHKSAPAAHATAPSGNSSQPRHSGGATQRSQSRRDSSGEREHSGSNTREHSGGTDDHSGSGGDSTRSGSGGSDDHSGSRSGSDDVAATQIAPVDDHSGSSGSDDLTPSGTSGSSGPDTTSTSGSGSGSDDSLSSGSGSSGSSEPLDH